ncbi:hypothetical protein BU17DRAFT_65666 [Hysterangium stoloniferum]|nr:hypothetical protein BU17DRAFT_65666 [Hysterangium stoloniferum]
MMSTNVDMPKEQTAKMETALKIALCTFRLVLASQLRTLEEDVILFRGRFQHVGSLSSVISQVPQQAAFLAAVNAQFVSFTFQKSDTPIQKAANATFVLGVAFNVMGAASSLGAASSMPSISSIDEEFKAYQGAIEALERMVINVDSSQDIDVTKLPSEQLRLWKREHYRNVRFMRITSKHIRRWNRQSAIYTLVMQLGIACFWLGLLFFLIDTQNIEIWLTVLLIAVVAYILIFGVEALGSWIAQQHIQLYQQGSEREDGGDFKHLACRKREDLLLGVYHMNGDSDEYKSISTLRIINTCKQSNSHTWAEHDSSNAGTMDAGLTKISRWKILQKKRQPSEFFNSKAWHFNISEFGGRWLRLLYRGDINQDPEPIALLFYSLRPKNTSLSCLLLTQ